MANDEIAALRADAEKYRFLRRTAIMGYPSSEGSNQKDAYLVITGHGWEDSEETVDAAVQEAMAKEQQNTCK